MTLYEQGESLGGRLAGWPVRLADGSGATMSRGFHAFFRQYYNLRGLLRRTDPGLSALTPLPDYPLRHRNGLADSFARVPRTPPWSALGFVALSPSFGWRDLAAMNPREALPLLDVRVPEVYERFDGVSAEDFLHRINFPEAAHHLAFEVFSRSFFADPRELSAAELLLMFHIYFLGSSEGLLFDVPREPFPQALWEPLGGYLRQLGAEVRTGAPVHRVRPAADGDLTVETDGAADRHQAVVLALDTRGLRHVVGASEQMGDASWRADIAALRTAPPFLVSRLWLDRPVREDRAGFLGTSGFDGLDNVSVLDRWEGESARWAARTGGSVVELHAYAVDEGAEQKEVQRRMLDRLREVYPETADAEVVDARHEWRADCPVHSVGGYHHAADRADASSSRRAGGRPGPHRPPRRPDGACRDLGFPGRQRAPRRLGHPGAGALDRPAHRALPGTARPRGSGRAALTLSRGSVRCSAATSGARRTPGRHARGGPPSGA